MTMATKNGTEKTIKTIKVVPTWRGILPILVEAAANGTTPEGRKAAWDELFKLADKVDARNAEIIAEKEKNKATR